MARNFCLLIAAAALLYGSEEFILWAKISTKNNSVIYDKLALSKAMVLSELEYEYLCEIDASKQSAQSSLDFLNLHKNELFECFLHYKFKVEDRFVQYNKNMSSATDLTLFPVRFTVKFKPSSAIISVFKNKE
ncbi:hypothetical protein [Campylobacter rectus]|uniref:hypothetical protein n=1 Tax=Campylobacter rectus TaxID=203 RepID=UPI0028DCD970|nr:hypothetical protein [Campylobacter rectus]